MRVSNITTRRGLTQYQAELTGPNIKQLIKLEIKLICIFRILCKVCSA